jgi:hypothetical protein
MDEPAEDGEPAVRRVAFHHDPQALMAQLEAGATQLEELAFSVPDRPCTAEFRREAGELSVRVL